MSERARYHAARQKVRVTERTPHNQLYPLIDILIEHAHDSSGQVLVFSGYTLSSLQWLGQWEERDRRFFFQWLREPAQVRLIEQARQRLLAENTQPKEQVHPYPSRLYSVLRHRLQALPLARAPAAQWQRTLLNMKRDGLRREELDWSGLLNFLARQPKGQMIDKASLLEAIDFSAILPRLCNELECDRRCRLALREVGQKMAAFQLQLAGLPVGEQDLGVVRYLCASPSYRIGAIWPEKRALQAPRLPRWFVLGPYGQAIAHPERKVQLLFASREEAIEVAERHAQRNHHTRCDLSYRAQYEYMTLHGGAAYREWLVTLPDYHHSHFTGHFYERNILLHLRTKVRTTGDGRRVLFIEELQSDWQQAAARHGVRRGIPLAPFRREWPSLALKLMLLHVAESGLDGIAWTDAAVHELRYEKALAPLHRLYDEEMPRLLNTLGNPWGARVEQAAFATRRPWLHAVRSQGSWKVEGGAGKFATRSGYSQQEALALIERHSKAITLALPVWYLPEGMRRHIREAGLPLFGEQLLNGGSSGESCRAAESE